MTLSLFMPRFKCLDIANILKKMFMRTSIITTADKKTRVASTAEIEGELEKELGNVNYFIILQGAGHRRENAASVVDLFGTEMFIILENVKDLERAHCFQSRSFYWHLVDAENVEIARYHHPLITDFPWFYLPCFFQKLEVYASNDALLGTISQTWCNNFDIIDARGESVLKICKPSFIIFRCYRDLKFDIYDGGNRIGRIRIPWLGSPGNNIARKFMVSFPNNLDTQLKFCVLGTCLLIENMYVGKFGEGYKTCTISYFFHCLIRLIYLFGIVVILIWSVIAIKKHFPNIFDDIL